MLLFINTDILLNEIFPWLNYKSLGRLSRSCKFLNKLLNRKLSFAKRSLLKLKRKKDFWKINLDRFWKMKCPLDKREYHVVCDEQDEIRRLRCFKLSSEKIRRKIDVIENITFIGQILNDKEIESQLYKGVKLQTTIVVGNINAICELYADVERLSENTSENSSDHNHYYAFHLKIDFPLLLYFSIYRVELHLGSIRIPQWHEIFPTIIPKNIIVKGYKIKDLVCTLGEKEKALEKLLPTESSYFHYNCITTCKYHQKMVFYIRLRGESETTSSWNLLRYIHGFIMGVYFPNYDSIKTLKSEWHYKEECTTIIPKND